MQQEEQTLLLPSEQLPFSPISLCRLPLLVSWLLLDSACRCTEQNHSFSFPHLSSCSPRHTAGNEAADELTTLSFPKPAHVEEAAFVADRGCVIVIWIERYDLIGMEIAL